MYGLVVGLHRLQIEISNWGLILRMPELREGEFFLQLALNLKPSHPCQASKPHSSSF